MNICQRIEAEITRLNAVYPATEYVSDDDAMTAMARVWVASGGETGGLDDYYVEKLRDAIARVEKGAA